MRLVTFCTKSDPSPRVGLRHRDRVLDLTANGLPSRMRQLLAGGRPALERARSLADAWRRKPGQFAAVDEKDIAWLPPVPDAEKLLCVGKNYRSHLEELSKNDLITETPQEPTAFVKLNSCLSGHDARVARPKGIVQFDYEPELMFSTGAPGGVAVGKPNAAELFLKPGDVIECSIEGIATLRTYIVAP